jgi:predicted nucleotidyltransferase
MSPISAAQSPGVAMSPAVEQILADLVQSAKDAFGDDLICMALFGSGAEGRLRATSDLNLLVVLARFQRDRADKFREPLRVARIAAKAAAMFLLESEAATAAEAFAVKFGDIARRHRVLVGQLPKALMAVSPEAKKQRLLQTLMNLTLRLRQSYVAMSLREEQLALVIAETAGALRSSAAMLLELEGRPVASPKESLETVAGSLDGGKWSETLRRISEARESRSLPPGAAAPALFNLMALVDAMRLRAERLP